jgi:hypothetical protein
MHSFETIQSYQREADIFLAIRYHQTPLINPSNRSVPDEPPVLSLTQEIEQRLRSQLQRGGQRLIMFLSLLFRWLYLLLFLPLYYVGYWLPMRCADKCREPCARLLKTAIARIKAPFLSAIRMSAALWRQVHRSYQQLSALYKTVIRLLDWRYYRQLYRNALLYGRSLLEMLTALPSKGVRSIQKMVSCQLATFAHVVHVGVIFPLRHLSTQLLDSISKLLLSYLSLPLTAVVKAGKLRCKILSAYWTSQYQRGRSLLQRLPAWASLVPISLRQRKVLKSSKAMAKLSKPAGKSALILHRQLEQLSQQLSTYSVVVCGFLTLIATPLQKKIKTIQLLLRIKGKALAVHLASWLAMLPISKVCGRCAFSPKLKATAALLPLPHWIHAMRARGIAFKDLAYQSLQCSFPLLARLATTLHAAAQRFHYSCCFAYAWMSVLCQYAASSCHNARDSWTSGRRQDVKANS